MNEIGEDLDLECKVRGVLDQVCEPRVESRLAADELHHLDTQFGALTDDISPRIFI